MRLILWITEQKPKHHHSLFFIHFSSSCFFYGLMDSPKPHPKGLKLKTSLILTLIISLTLTCFPSHSDGSASTEKGLKQKMVLGSRPPGCFNKCLGCNPCKAALIISPHHKALSVHQRDEGYYLLSWKCKCGNKIFQP